MEDRARVPVAEKEFERGLSPAQEKMRVTRADELDTEASCKESMESWSIDGKRTRMCRSGPREGQLV